MSKNPRCQFELKSIFHKELISSAYEWCKANLPLKDEKSIQYWVDELYIITSSQKVLDKVNEHFGSHFSFKSEEFWDSRVYFLEKL